ncbi:M56 family metallopeptidase [Gimesia panareensis]|uniref:M56 family metallopeptidase n=1 Tax=Gimesia panareensis TaxID=2527978 RepID=UPI00118AB13C|nr:M56 family metallopeptidase [Gimesia panareensis]QDU49529.1 Methicillin resistance mecR1 protein [Gimesia panareensis]
MLENNIAYFAVHVLLQTTFLIAVAALTLRMLSYRKPAAQSVILRVTLIAVLICPCLSLILGQSGVTRYALLPAWQSPAQTESFVAVGTNPQPASLLPGTDSSEETGQASGARVPVPSVRLEQASHLTSAASAAPSTQTPSVVLNRDASALSVERDTISVTTFFNGSVIVLWLTGTLFLLSRVLQANIQGYRICRGSEPASEEVQQLCAETAALLNLHAPRVKVTSRVHSPCLIGWRNPLILLPVGQQQTNAALQDVILHELAHLSRWDCLFHLLARIMTAVLFFQPLTWWLSRRLDRIADDLCDDYVIHYGSGRKQYANTLVDYAEQFPWQSVAPEPGLAMVSSRSSLSRRILRIMDSSRTLNLRLQTGWILFIALLGLSATATAAVVLKDQQPDLTSEVSAVEQTLSAVLESPAPTDEKASPPAPSSKDVKVEKQNAGPVFQFQGRVLNTEEQPVAQAKLFYHFKTHPELIPLASTDAQGKYDFSIPPAHPLYEDIDQSHGMILVKAPGYGLGFKTPLFTESSGVLWDLFDERDPYPEEQAATPLPAPEKPITFRLFPDDSPLTGRIVDSDGQPVVGATVKVTYIVPGGKARMDEWEAAMTGGESDYYRARSLLGLMTFGSEISELNPEPLSTAVTDVQGRFQISGFGRDRLVQLLVSGPSIATDKIFARTRQGKMLRVRTSSNTSIDHQITVYPIGLTYVAGPSIPVTGVIRDAKTGKPIAGAQLISNQLATRNSWGFSRDLVRTFADEQGRYRLEGLPIGKNLLYGLPPSDQPYLTSEVILETQAGMQQLQQDIRLTRGIWVEGRAFDRDTGEPVLGGQVEYFAFPDNPHLKQMQFPLDTYSWYYHLDQEGKYRIPVLPGRGILTLRLFDFNTYQLGRGVENIPGIDQQMGAFRTAPYFVIPLNYHYLTEVNPEPGNAPLKMDFPLQPDRTITVKVVDQAGQPVTGGQYYGLMETVNNWLKVKGDTFRVRGYRSETPRRIQYFNSERELAGFMVLKGDIPSEVTLTLQSGWATVKGRLVDKQGKPRAGGVISNTFSQWNDPTEFGVIPPELSRETDAWNRIITNKNGEFTITGLALGCKYKADVTKEIKGVVNGYGGNFKFETPLESGQVVDLGDIQPQDD